MTEQRNAEVYAPTSVHAHLSTAYHHLGLDQGHGRTSTRKLVYWHVPCMRGPVPPRPLTVILRNGSILSDATYKMKQLHDLGYPIIPKRLRQDYGQPQEEPWTGTVIEQLRALSQELKSGFVLPLTVEKFG